MRRFTRERSLGAFGAVTVLVVGLAACGGSTHSATGTPKAPSSASTTPSKHSTSSGTSVPIGSGVRVTLPAGWSVQGGWDTPDASGTKGVSVQNNKPGSGAVVVDFAVNMAATVNPTHPAPTNASEALKDWTNSLDDSVDTLGGPISNAQFAPISTGSLSSPGFDQMAGRAYKGALNGGANNVAGFMLSAWNPTSHHDVFAWLITSDERHALSALPMLQTMAQSLGA